jgi:hypothetical protein
MRVLRHEIPAMAWARSSSVSWSRTTTDVFLVEEGTVETVRGEVAPYIDG